MGACAPTTPSALPARDLRRSSRAPRALSACAAAAAQTYAPLAPNAAAMVWPWPPSNAACEPRRMYQSAKCAYL